MNVVVGFWKTWTAVEKKAPIEHKDAKFIRVSAGFVGVGLVDGFEAFNNDVKYYAPRGRARDRDENYLFAWVPMETTMRSPKKITYFLASFKVGDEGEEILVFPSLTAFTKKMVTNGGSFKWLVPLY